MFPPWWISKLVLNTFNSKVWWFISNFELMSTEKSSGKLIADLFHSTTARFLDVFITFHPRMKVVKSLKLVVLKTLFITIHATENTRRFESSIWKHARNWIKMQTLNCNQKMLANNRLRIVWKLSWSFFFIYFASEEKSVEIFIDTIFTFVFNIDWKMFLFDAKTMINRKQKQTFEFHWAKTNLIGIIHWNWSWVDVTSRG